MSGTAGEPRIDLEAGIVRGAIRDEPFDIAALTVKYAGDRTENIAGHVLAGRKRIDLKGSYQYTQGRLTFEARSNAMPLDQFQTLLKTRPDLSGNATVHRRRHAGYHPRGRPGREPQRRCRHLRRPL